MSLTKYLILTLIATLLCCSALGIILYTVNPFETTALGFVLFYLSLFFSLMGILSLVSFLFRHWFIKHQFVKYQIITSLRQSVLISFLIVVSLFLKSYHLIAWWNLLILVIMLTAIEYMFFVKSNNQLPDEKEN